MWMYFCTHSSALIISLSPLFSEPALSTSSEARNP